MGTELLRLIRMRMWMLATLLLVSTALGFSVTVEEKQESPYSLGSRFFFNWCDLYKESCRSGCSKTECGSGATCRISHVFCNTEYKCEDITPDCEEPEDEPEEQQTTEEQETTAEENTETTEADSTTPQ